MANYNSKFMNTGRVSGATPSKNIKNNYVSSTKDITIDEGKATYVDSLIMTNLPSKDISISFGREEDYIELHIFNLQDQLLYSEPNFKDYTTEEGKLLSNSINIDPEKILQDRKYISGQYRIQIHIHRNKIFNSSYFPFFIKEISPSRKEIKSISEDVENNLFDEAINSFILELESAAYFKEFTLNFGGGKLVPAVNLLLNKDPLKHELILKTLNPLQSEIPKGSKFKIVEELTDPISVEIDLGGQNISEDGINLRGPNFQIDTKKHSSIPSKFRNYNEILEYNLTSSYNKLLNKLENPDTLNIHYDYVHGVSSSMEEHNRNYHFDNFVHFSSAVERLKNFEYKLKLIEDYDAQVVEIQSIEGSISNSNTILTEKENIKTKKRNLIKGFDGYEHFLYYTTGSNVYTWPKYDGSAPYGLYSVTSSEAINWLGDANGEIPSYSGQLLSASLYDRKNPNNLSKLIPQHILDNSDNQFYLNFVNMIGQHFDLIWAHIDHISEINHLDNKFGISKELVYYQLKSLGIDTFDQFENANLIEYILGEGLLDHSVGNLIVGDYIVGGLSNAFYNTPAGVTTFVTSSNEGSIPKGEITREIWKRLYNNAPYLLKTKGTERGLRALMNCYGVPSTILNIKEYGGNTLLSGPLKDLKTAGTYKTFSYDKSGLALEGESGATGYFIATNWSSSLTDALSASMKTVEWRIKPNRINNENQHLFTLSGSDATKDPHLILTNYTGNDISESNDSTQYGRIDLYINGSSVANTNNFPIFNGDFWTIFIGTSGSEGNNSDIEFGVYQSNWLKNITSYTSSFEITPQTRQLTFGDPWYGNNNIGGGSTIFFGGTIANPASEYDNIDTLKYSGSIQEIKYHFGELLSHETLKKHALEPFMYAGNTVSSSYDNVVLRLPLGSNDQEDSGSFQPNIDVNYLEYAGVGYSSVGTGFEVGDYSRKTSSSMASQNWEEVIETHHLPTPDTVGASMTSEKVRIDDGTINSDNILMVDKSAETSTLDRQPPDYEDLGVHFSPTFEMNEDIIYSLGSFRLDDYIGNPLPSAQTASAYEDLKDIQEFYVKKLRDKYNYWDYIRIIQKFDHTLFKIVEQFVPFKSNIKTGLLIEPTYLERNKFAREVPIRSDAQTMTTGSHQTFNAQLQTYYKGNNLYTFASTSLYDMDDLPLSSSQTFEEANLGDWFLSASNYSPTSSGVPTTKGQWEPGTYVVSDNNLLFTTSSKTGERLERGTNTTIEIYSDYMDPFLRKRNRFGALHSFNGQDCQAPIRPFLQTLNLQYVGIGSLTIGSPLGIGNSSIGNGFIVGAYTPDGGFDGSFIIGEYYNNVGGVPSGVEFSSIGENWTIGNYQGTGFTIGSATVGSTFVVGVYTSQPAIDPSNNYNYRTHKSNVLLGNCQTGRKSKKYFKYHTYETQGSSVIVG